MSSPLQVTINTRSGRGLPISVDWMPTDTIEDILERAGLEPRRISGVSVGPNYFRSFCTESVWPNTTIEVNDI